MRIQVLLTTFVIVLAFSVYSVSTGIGNIVTSNRQLADKQTELQQEEQRRSILIADIQKFDDPDYIRQYAQGEYHYTAPGEIVFILPADSEPEVTDTNGQKESTTNVA